MYELSAVLRGVVIAEGLEDPTIINRVTVVRAQISRDGLPIDYEGGEWSLASLLEGCR